MKASGRRVTVDKLLTDFSVLATDMEQLLKATADDTGQHVAQARGKAEESLKAAQARIADLQDRALARARAAGRETESYVHANPWPVMAVCAATGLALGVLLTRDGKPDA
jgi:ElaB/YqjD/DUF883 family membrane-anchored ribosome-binding protein